MYHQINNSMSTNSNIGKILPGGRIKSIYCHWDGQPSNVGETLKKHYTDESKIDNLLDLGSLELLGENIGTKLNKPTSKDNQCIFYGRDHNLKDTKPKIYEDIKSWMNKPIIEWYYLWNGKEWETYKSEYQY